MRYCSNVWSSHSSFSSFFLINPTFCRLFHLPLDISTQDSGDYYGSNTRILKDRNAALASITELILYALKSSAQIQIHLTSVNSIMTTVAKLHLPPLDCYKHSGQPPPARIILRHRLLWDPVGAKARRRVWIRPCRSFKSDQEGFGFGEREKKCEETCAQVTESSDIGSGKSVNKFVDGIREAVWRVSKPSLRSEGKFTEAMEKLEETLFSVSSHVQYSLVSCNFWKSNGAEGVF